jgi:hypothetical protein
VLLFNDIVIAGHRVNAVLFAAVLAALLLWVVIYLIYKMAFRADFGLPVRRRLLCNRLTVERDQAASVPLWWSDLQIQRAVRAYWKQSLRSTVGSMPDQHVEDRAGR